MAATPASDSTGKKTTTKKATTKKASNGKTTASKAGAKKTASKKTATEKSATEKSAAKKSAAKKSASKKTASKKTATEKAATRKTATRKTATRKTATRKTTAASKAAKPTKTAAKSKSSSGSRATKRTGGALVVVESPAKARTIKKYLGTGYTVKASVGHIKDLPKSRLGVDVDNEFEPEYVVIRDKKKVIGEIKKAAKTASVVYLAPDPDREGEAIAWHIAEEIKKHNDNIKRVLFNEITRKGITAALETPTDVDTNKTDAQQARRILDRLVGYEISPILWKKVRRGLSAGRVQSVAVRLLVEREREIAAFVPVEYWSVEATCRAVEPPPFTAKVFQWDGAKAAPENEAAAAEMATELSAGSAAVAKVDRKQRRRSPKPPFITSTLQQEAARKLRFAAKRTMRIAQRLYEGVEVGDEGPVGLITYMRTDSTRVADDAIADVRGHIAQTYGADFLPEKPNFYRSSKRAQDAHEAVRPTSMMYPPDKVAKALSGHRDGADLVKLYGLIWRRFVASQMANAIYDQTTVDIERGRATLRATGQVMRFAGYTQVYTEQETDDAAAEKASDQDRPLPPLEVGDAITLDHIDPQQHFTQPPPRFTEASLVKELEEKGIGRPSTYATILSTIVDRGYVAKEAARFFPTELGILVNELLVDAFPNILDSDFTAQMEADLDKIEEGERDWRELLAAFYRPFSGNVEKAKTNMRNVKREEIPTEHVCEQCGSPMVIKWGRNGSFLACQGYPECRNTKEIARSSDGSFEIVPEEVTEETCPVCGAPMKVKKGRFGSFLACSRYPDCKTTKAISLGIDCPREGCKGFITEKRSRRGKVFYGCSEFAKTGCDFVVWDRPVAKPCPECGAPFLLRRDNRRGVSLRCASCSYKAAEGEEHAA